MEAATATQHAPKANNYVGKKIAAAAKKAKDTKPKPEPAKQEATERETASGFDYSLITDTKKRTKAQAIAKRIHANVRTTEKNLLANGRELTAIKDDLKHGLWKDWLSAEFRWSHRTAQNYMAVANRLADDYHRLTYLPSPTIYRLVASDKKIEPVRLEVVNAAKDGKPMPKDEVERLISQAKGKGGDGSEDPASTDKAAVRGTAAAKAIDMLRAELKDFDGFMVLVREAGREFTAALKEAANG